MNTTKLTQQDKEIMYHKSLFLIVICLLVAPISYGQKADLQKYSYEDEQLFISVSSVYKMNGLDTLVVNVEIQNQGEEIFVFGQKRLAINNSGCILILDLGGLFEANLDTEIELSRLKSGEKSFYVYKIPKSKLQDLNCSKFFSLTLTVGFVTERTVLKDSGLTSEIQTEIESKSLIISSIKLDEILKRLDLHIYNIKLR